MKDYSIENATTKINSKKTKEYFKEVSSSYFNGNYRAAIVTLYSVVIHDILIKLEVLEEVYADSTAKTVLDNIKTIQQTNPKNSEWEQRIIEEVKNRTSLLDNVDYAHIQALKNDRHLCAHPVIDKQDKLYTPNKELVASHIRNMLESLFLKPPVLSKKILSTILEDIEQKKDILIDETSIERYIESKYLNNLNESVEATIFRDLWKFIYRLDDDRSESNRQINYKLLYFLYKRNTPICIEKIKSEKEYFNNIKNDEKNVKYLIIFLSENEFMLPEFNDHVKLIMSNMIKKDNGAKIVAWFMSENYTQHLTELREIIPKDIFNNFPFSAPISAYNRLIKIGISKGYSKEIADFIAWRYSIAKDYNDGDKIFSNILKLNLDIFNLEQFKTLCELSGKNSQTYSRNQAKDDHRYLKEFIEKKHPKFDFEKYNKVFNQK
ncbi:hypothetical protein NH341_00140 [Tenacibaculum sp. XPcli2-G]|uniref:hypothetical protein n=1 Tax=Tenacibaculum sp. XPcli2-G TaxID=2954503 RepID=UPI002096DB6B|nr:hypothetical protein [Tenacibaculum sp. XPcli2-G]MCO7183821.1 hypothetical protein [Tenacibaculum sp. XPcli2-G]